jgi:hypothetical protein
MGHSLPNAQLGHLIDTRPRAGPGDSEPGSGVAWNMFTVNTF